MRDPLKPRRQGPRDSKLDFNGTPSNNVEVAFGTDADGDRSLSLDETDVVIGWECGRYFHRAVSDGRPV